MMNSGMGQRRTHARREQGARTLFFLLACITPCSCFLVPGGAMYRGQDVRGYWQQPSRFSISSASGGTGARVNTPGLLDLPRNANERTTEGHGSPRLSMSASSSAVSGIRTFFDASSISSAMTAANGVPPVYYFIYLLAAGVGVPVSEDLLVIFVGTLLANPEFTTAHKAACVAWCYFGVVFSDMLTYGIGFGFRRGLFNPLRRILFNDFGETEGSDTAGGVGGQPAAAASKAGKTEQILDRIRRSGKFVGVAERFAVGARGPMTLLCGFTGVPLRDFAAGVATGALIGTVPIQLALGHALRNRPTVVAAIGTAFISYYALGPPIVAAVGGATLWLARMRAGKDGAGEESDSGSEGVLELGAEGAGI